MSRATHHLPDFGLQHLSLMLLVIMAWPASVQGQTGVCREDRGVHGYIIRSVKIEARGGWVPPITLPIVPGDKFYRDNLNPAFRAVRDALENDPIQENFELEIRGSASVLYVTACVKVVEEPECQKAINALKKPEGVSDLEIQRRGAQS